VEDLVRAQLAHFANLLGSLIALHGPKLRLSATAAQAVGLALHELATNAGNYGALSVSDGCVDVGRGLDLGSAEIDCSKTVDWPIVETRCVNFSVI
jgi:two-component sensor histidine kinase